MLGSLAEGRPVKSSRSYHFYHKIQYVIERLSWLLFNQSIFVGSGQPLGNRRHISILRLGYTHPMDSFAERHQTAEARRVEYDRLQQQLKKARHDVLIGSCLVCPLT